MLLVLYGVPITMTLSAKVLEHWLGVSKADVTELAREHIKENMNTNYFKHFWILVSKGQPSKLPADCITNQVENINA